MVTTASDKTIWEVKKSRQKEYIDLLTSNLPELRGEIGVSQGELATMLGMARQTISAIETGVRPMTWATYLSLLLFFDCNEITHKSIRALGVYPYDLILTFNGGKRHDVPKWLAEVPDEIISKLDSDAYQNIRTVVMLEYSRCSKIPGDEVLTIFEKINFTKSEEN